MDPHLIILLSVIEDGIPMIVERFFLCKGRSKRVPRRLEIDDGIFNGTIFRPTKAYTSENCMPSVNGIPSMSRACAACFVD